MEPEGSLPHSDAPATCPYPEPAHSSPHTHIPLPEDEICKYCKLNTGIKSVVKTED
jgi:uncharacterized Zn-finger protein